MKGLDKVLSSIGVPTSSPKAKAIEIDLYSIARLASLHMRGRGFNKWWIAGGCLRDTILRKPYNDIDLFVRGNSDVDVYQSTADVLDSTDVNFCGKQINIIRMRSKHLTFAGCAFRCDFGICQISYDPDDDMIFITQAFIDDVVNKTFTLTRNTSVSRYEKMLKRLPDFSYVDDGYFVTEVMGGY